MKKCIVVTQRSDLRIRADPPRDERIVGGLDPGDEVYVDDSAPRRGPWMKLGLPPGWRPPPNWRPGWVHEDFLREVTAAPRSAPASARHLLVFIGGFLGPFSAREVRRGTHAPPGALPERGWFMTPGNEITRVDPRPRHPPRTCYQAYLRLKDAFAAPSQSVAIDPALDNGHEHGAVRAGLRVVAERPNPVGRFVLYGYSAGGFNALRLAERLARERPRTPVDLLVTVDACLQLLPGSSTFSVETPASVRRHLNFYQTVDGFQGRSMAHLGSDNVHCPGSPNAHDSMPLDTLPRVRAAIEGVLAALPSVPTHAAAVP